MKTIETFSNGTIRLLTDPQLYRVKHDFEIDGVWRQAPETQPLQEKNFTQMSKGIQELCFRLLQEENQGRFPDAELRSIYTGLYSYNKCFTNQKGYNKDTDPRRNYIEGEDLSAPLPQIESLVTGGNVIAGREDGAYLWVFTIDPNGDLSLVSRARTPWLVQLATIAKMDGKVIRFPDMVDENRGIYLNTPVPIISSHPVKIELRKLVKLPPDTISSPYVF